MLTNYIQAAMRQAKYEILSADGSFSGEIPGFEGVWANGSTLEECRDELQSALEDWILVRIAERLPLPIVDGIEEKDENYNINLLSANVLANLKPESAIDDLSSERSADLSKSSKSSIWNRISIIKGDITKQRVDAIVNTTDPYFSGSGVVDAAIHRAAGSELREECDRLNRSSRSEAKITSGYNLPARWVIHTVAPLWQKGNNNEDRMLAVAECYRNSLALAEEYSIGTIAFPAISRGLLGFPRGIAARIAVREVKGFLERNSSVEKVIFVCLEEKYYNHYLNAVKEIIE